MMNTGIILVKSLAPPHAMMSNRSPWLYTEPWFALPCPCHRLSLYKKWGAGKSVVACQSFYVYLTYHPRMVFLANECLQKSLCLWGRLHPERPRESKRNYSFWKQAWYQCGSARSIRDISSAIPDILLPVEDFPAGYPRFSALVGSHDSLQVYRRFSSIRSRNILFKQDKLSVLEQRLYDLDREEQSPSHLASFRRDVNSARQAVLSDIDKALIEYGTYILPAYYDQNPCVVKFMIPRWDFDEKRANTQPSASQTTSNHDTSELDPRKSVHSP